MNQVGASGAAAGLMQAMAGPSAQSQQPATSQSSNQLNIQVTDKGLQYDESCSR